LEYGSFGRQNGGDRELSKGLVSIIIAIRGATTAIANSREHIVEATSELLIEIMKANYLHERDIVSIIFTSTPDLNSAFPAEAARMIGLVSVPLLGTQEVAVVGALGLCVRVMIFVDKDILRDDVKHVYLRGSAGLRPDLVGGGQSMRAINIAIDGPAGAGKSTVAKCVAKRFGLRYLDTGAMYRAVTWLALSQGLDLQDSVCLGDLARKTVFDLDASSQLTLGGRVLGDEIRTPAVNASVSLVSSYEEVREVIVEKQRKLAELGGIVMDGRDIGTTVLKDAELKFFLVADPKERARRRLAELRALGHEVDFESVVSQIEQRDYFDSHRQISPLQPAHDAVIVDTTNVAIDDVVERVLEIAARKRNEL